MGAIERKKREFELRQQEFLSLAEELYAEYGESGVTMDKLVEKADYSKGTVYKHFSSKEDLIAALGLELLKQLRELHQIVAELPGTSRQKMVAFHATYYYFTLQHGPACSLMSSCKTGLVKERMSAERRAQLENEESQIIKNAVETTKQGVEDGDLALDGTSTPFSISFINHALASGFINIIQSHEFDEQLGDLGDLEPHYFEAMSKLLDGYHWKPLSNEFDYSSTVDTVKAVFQQNHPKRVNKLV